MEPGKNTTTIARYSTGVIFAMVSFMAWWKITLTIKSCMPYLRANTRTIKE
jgi:hypothetical protein